MMLAALAAAVLAGLSFWDAHEARSELARSKGSFTSPAALASGGCAETPQSGLPVEGTADLVNGERVWLLLQAPGAGRFYIPKSNALDVRTTNKWSITVSNIGSKVATDQGAEFTLVLVAVDLNADNVIHRAYSKAKKNEGAFLDNLPQGAKAIAQACLRRS